MTRRGTVIGAFLLVCSYAYDAIHSETSILFVRQALHAHFILLPSEWSTIWSQGGYFRTELSGPIRRAGATIASEYRSDTTESEADGKVADAVCNAYRYVTADANLTSVLSAQPNDLARTITARVQQDLRHWFPTPQQRIQDDITHVADLYVESTRQPFGRFSMDQAKALTDVACDYVDQVKWLAG